MKEFISKNSLKIFVSALFILAVGITIMLSRYSDELEDKVETQRIDNSYALSSKKTGVSTENVDTTRSE